MNNSLGHISLSTIKTLFILIAFEILSSALIPAIGLGGLKLGFNILIVLYIAFKLDTPYMAYVILIIQYFHSVFTIEGWGITTLIGVSICLMVRFLKDMLDFSTALSTIIVVQLFQLLWFLIFSILLSIKSGSFDLFLDTFLRGIPASLVISIISPFFFILMDKIWVPSKDASVGV